MIDKILIKCPSELHKEFIKYACDFFERNKCKALLKGSLYKNTANRYSDIDLVIKRINKNIVEKFIYDFEEVALISRTQRPLGIIIVVYSNGLCLDLDFRDTILKEEYEESDMLGIEFNREDISDTLLRCENILEIESDNEWYNMQRLFHRSIIKWLGGNRELGESILDEIITFLKDEEIDIKTDNKSFKEKYKTVLYEYNKSYKLDKSYIKILWNLLEEV